MVVQLVSENTEHMNHIRAVIGVDHIGIGSDFDGIDKYKTPTNLYTHPRGSSISIRSNPHQNSGIGSLCDVFL
jgi:microsomal dipeptidase-like Zn-dependent dipeptidase